MNEPNSSHLKGLIRKHLSPFFEQAGITPETVGDEDNLYARGILDSYGTVEILVAIEDETGISADLERSADDDEILTLTISRIASFFQNDRST